MSCKCVPDAFFNASNIKRLWCTRPRAQDIKTKAEKIIWKFYIYIEGSLDGLNFSIELIMSTSKKPPDKLKK